MIIQGTTLKNTGFVVDASIVTSGLVYYIDAGKSGYTSGTSINNLASTAIGASTLSNSPIFTNTGVSSYFSFNGSNQLIYTPSLYSLFTNPVNDNITLEVWIRTSTDNGVAVAEQGNSPINSGWYDSQIEIVSGSLHVDVWTAPGYGPNTTVGAVTRNQFQQYAMTYNATTGVMTGYINAAGVSSAPFTRLSPMDNNNGQLYYTLMYSTITNLGDGTSLAGDLALFRVYNRALTASEITQNFSADRWRYGV